MSDSFATFAACRPALPNNFAKLAIGQECGCIDAGAEVAAKQTLIETIGQALRNRGYAALRNLDIEICGGIVILGGHVPSYYEKQLAQATARQVVGDCRIKNAIEVIHSR